MMVMRRRVMLSVFVIGVVLVSCVASQQQVNGNGGMLYAYVPPAAYTMMPPSPPFIMIIPPSPIVSAQQVCTSQTGWQWRSDGFAMCFRPGNVPCPGGYPWIRRATEHYTVCVSKENQSSMASGASGY